MKCFQHDDARLPGFSLVELLVAISIIGALASIVLGAISGASKNAKDKVIAQNLKSSISNAELFYSDFSTYGSFNPLGDFTGGSGRCDIDFRPYGNETWAVFNGRDPSGGNNEFAKNINDLLIVSNEKSGGEINTAGKLTKSRCAVNDRSYAFAITLATDDEKSWCVDSSGFSGEVNYVAETSLSVFSYDGGSGILTCNS